MGAGDHPVVDQGADGAAEDVHAGAAAAGGPVRNGAIVHQGAQDAVVHDAAGPTARQKAGIGQQGHRAAVGDPLPAGDAARIRQRADDGAGEVVDGVGGVHATAVGQAADAAAVEDGRVAARHGAAVVQPDYGGGVLDGVAVAAQGAGDGPVVAQHSDQAGVGDGELAADAAAVAERGDAGAAAVVDAGAVAGDDAAYAVHDDGDGGGGGVADRVGRAGDRAGVRHRAHLAGVVEARPAVPGDGGVGRVQHRADAAAGIDADRAAVDDTGVDQRADAAQVADGVGAAADDTAGAVAQNGDGGAVIAENAGSTGGADGAGVDQRTHHGLAVLVVHGVDRGADGGNDAAVGQRIDGAVVQQGRGAAEAAAPHVGDDAPVVQGADQAAIVGHANPSAGDGAAVHHDGDRPAVGDGGTALDAGADAVDEGVDAADVGETGEADEGAAVGQRPDAAVVHQGGHGHGRDGAGVGYRTDGSEVGKAARVAKDGADVEQQADAADGCVAQGDAADKAGVPQQPVIFQRADGRAVVQQRLAGGDDGAGAGDPVGRQVGVAHLRAGQRGGNGGLRLGQRRRRQRHAHGQQRGAGQQAAAIALDRVALEHSLARITMSHGASTADVRNPSHHSHHHRYSPAPGHFARAVNPWHRQWRDSLVYGCPPQQNIISAQKYSYNSASKNEKYRQLIVLRLLVSDWIQHNIIKSYFW
ncbi:hypothetical protein AZA_79367 [Nitrospirillum viridazoti Y2]|nr:hypothetical protein AZA_79367 [Nitrospirillum amazonense Y2]